MEKVKYSYPHSEWVTNIDIDNIHDLKISYGANYVFVGKSTLVIRDNEIHYVKLFES